MPAYRLAIATLMSAVPVTGRHTTPAVSSGFFASYDNMSAPEEGGAAIRQRRDDSGSDAVAQVFLAPATLTSDAAAGVSFKERAMALCEVDRQICFGISERFVIAAGPPSDAATLRTAVVRIQPTGWISSMASAAVGSFVPVINLRAPSLTGGLAIESELLEAGAGRQIAAFSWARTAQYVGRGSPSLSPVGDALQMVGPLENAVGDAFATKDRK